MDNQKFVDILRARFTDPPLPARLLPAQVADALRAAPIVRRPRYPIRQIAASAALLVVVAGAALVLGLPRFNRSQNADSAAAGLSSKITWESAADAAQPAEGDSDSGGAATVTEPFGDQTNDTSMATHPVADSTARQAEPASRQAAMRTAGLIAAALAAFGAAAGFFWHSRRRRSNRPDNAGPV